ncbi:N-6 DNA methylase [Curtobacterium pusillum]|uniref:N-6 DNA methylase n=1 Tax=Curtobacterium pusillum TaxID=69373 RepID=UPI001C92DC5B|nr:N-6 DNA methylase [Curtobacterium pusillum]
MRTETETVIKRILPYLRRRGYEPEQDIDFETPVSNLDRYTNGYVDLLVTAGKASPQFVLEAKRSGKTLNAKDSKQALDYGKALNVPFVVVTNGQVVRVFNTANGEPLRWNGKLADKVPSRDQLPKVMAALRRKKDLIDVPLGDGDASLPFRPSLPLKQLNDLFARCHNKIRNIEKNEEHAFADFSKILFLKLLEEKEDAGGFSLPYSYRFWELADRPSSHADQVKSAILQMLSDIKSKGYGDVLTEDLHLKNPATFAYLVQELAKVSFSDSDVDVKGTAFEYFVRATLKGKKLGQYFTPRPVVEMMAGLANSQAIVNSLLASSKVLVADPACGTGGFLVYLLRESLQQLETKYLAQDITKTVRDEVAKKLMQEVFHGSDANDGVASAAKMNMIIAGDGHNNIQCENSVLPTASIWPMGEQRYSFILTNPPFGTVEGDALSKSDAALYPVSGTGKGQQLFIQRMVEATLPGGTICTVIDEGLLNTETGAALRRWVMQQTRIRAIVHLPDVTFRPNKINVRSSVLVLQKRETPDIDMLDSSPVTFADVETLGYTGTGEALRNFDTRKFIDEVVAGVRTGSGERHGGGWRAFDVPATEVAKDATSRWDVKYWRPETRASIEELNTGDGRTIRELNLIETRRGKSPSASTYVDAEDGYAAVVKAGSCITRYGTIDLDGADWIEKAPYDEFPTHARLQLNDVVLASTGDGTLGKAAVWELDQPAVADGHVTIIRTDPAVINPRYLADFLREGFGKVQIERLFTGGTGLIELTPEHVNSIRVAMRGGVEQQASLSNDLRATEAAHLAATAVSIDSLTTGRAVFKEASGFHAALAAS